MSATESNLKFYKIYEDAIIPTFASSGSACFDVYAYINPEAEIVAWTDAGAKQISKQLRNDKQSVVIYPNERMLVPTGLIIDIPKENLYVRLYARSGNAFKKGLTLANGLGIIDYDYIEETKVMLHNISDMNVVINNGDRVCQGELVSRLSYSLEETDLKPAAKTDRDGGFGSTGE